MFGVVDVKSRYSLMLSFEVRPILHCVCPVFRTSRKRSFRQILLSLILSQFPLTLRSALILKMFLPSNNNMAISKTDKPCHNRNPNPHNTSTKYRDVMFVLNSGQKNIVMQTDPSAGSVGPVALILKIECFPIDNTKIERECLRVAEPNRM